MIVDILKKYAYENKKKVVIVTHNPQVYMRADVLYKIEGKAIRCLSDLKESKEFEEEKDSETIQKRDLVDKNKLSFSFMYRYISQIHKKDRLKKRLIYSLLGFAIALTVIGANFGQAFVLQQRELLNSISKNELLVINKTVPLSDNKNVDDYLSITESDIQKISKITGVEKINPLIEFRSNGASMDGPIETSRIEKENGKKYVFSSDSAGNLKSFSILPFMEWNDYSNCSVIVDKNVDKGVYITDGLAKKLGISDLHNTEIKIRSCIPYGLFDTKVHYETKEYPADVDISIQKSITVTIKGILDASIGNRYTIYGDDVIYMNYNQMDEILHNGSNEQNDLRPWSSSALIIHVSDFNLLDTVKQSISGVNPNLLVVNEIQNLIAMQETVSKTQNAVVVFSIMVLVIVFILMSVIYIQQVEARKYEFAMLKANGLRKSEINKLVFYSSLIDIVKIVIICLLISIILSVLVNLILGANLILFSLKGVTQTMFLSAICVLIPTLITLRIVNNFSPDTVIRN